jgi:hypothetical protein
MSQHRPNSGVCPHRRRNRHLRLRQQWWRQPQRPEQDHRQRPCLRERYVQFGQERPGHRVAHGQPARIGRLLLPTGAKPQDRRSDLHEHRPHRYDQQRLDRPRHRELRMPPAGCARRLRLAGQRFGGPAGRPVLTRIRRVSRLSSPLSHGRPLQPLGQCQVFVRSSGPRVSVGLRRWRAHRQAVRRPEHRCRARVRCVLHRCHRGRGGARLRRRRRSQRAR